METTAHIIDEKKRTSDIKLSEKVPFSKMLLSSGARNGLNRAGYVYPTVLQANAIPIGKAGIDLIVQSKSGTGKTLIFAVVLLESCKWDETEQHSQALVLTPTREIAVQIESNLNVLGSSTPGFKAVSVIGGLDVVADRKRIQNAGAIVGTPGRVLHLIHNEVLNTKNIKLFVLDEADKMLTSNFRTDFEKIYNSLPSKKQMIACSATFSNELDSTLAKYMRNPFLISTEKRSSILVGIKQLVYKIAEEKTNILEMTAKIAALKQIFSNVSFKQCLIFSNSQSRAESYRSLLEKDGWACEVISGAQDQKTRLEVFNRFREFKTRILVSTDLMSRGVDSENVNLVVNLEVPEEGSTYLHRIGRAGRFGSQGIAITLISSEKDHNKFNRVLEAIGSQMQVLKYPKDGNVDLWNFDDPVAEMKQLGVFDANENFEWEKENMSDNNQEANYRLCCEKNDDEEKKGMVTNLAGNGQELPVDADRCLSNSKRNCLQIEEPSRSSLADLLCDLPNPDAGKPNVDKLNKLDVLKELIDAKPVKKFIKADESHNALRGDLNPFDDYVRTKDIDSEVQKSSANVIETVEIKVKTEDINRNEVPGECKDFAENAAEKPESNIPNNLRDSLRSALIEQPKTLRESGDIFEDYGSFTVSSTQNKTTIDNLKVCDPHSKKPTKKSVKEAIRAMQKSIVSSSDSKLPSASNCSITEPQPSTSSQAFDASFNTIKTSSPGSSISSPYPNTTSFTSADQTGKEFDMSTTTEGCKNFSLHLSDSSSDEQPDSKKPNDERRHQSNEEESSSESSLIDSDSTTDTATENNRESSGFDEKVSGASSGVVTTEESSTVSYGSSSSESVTDSFSESDETDKESTDDESQVETRCKRSKSRRKEANESATHQTSFTKWTELYWDQVSHIHDYVHFNQYAKTYAAMYSLNLGNKNQQ